MIDDPMITHEEQGVRDALDVVAAKLDRLATYESTNGEAGSPPRWHLLLAARAQLEATRTLFLTACEPHYRKAP